MKKLLILLLSPLSAASQQIDTIIFKFANGDIKYLVARGGVGVGTDSLYVQHNGVRSILSPMDLPVNTATVTALSDKLSTTGNGSSLTGLTKTQVGLTNADNTSDASKPVSTAQATAIAARGYALNVQAITSSPTDAQTIYFGQLPKAPVTAAATSKVFIRKAGTIKIANIYCFSGTAGTNEAWVISIRLNNTTDTQIASVSLATSERVFSNTSLSIAVAAGDYIEIKSVNPTWATNPLTTIFGGYIYIE